MRESFNVTLPFRRPLSVRRPLRALAFGLAAGLLASLAVVATCGSASALSKEQAIANCRESVGRPLVIACMRASGGGEANFARCREGATPKVKACVMAALTASNGRAN